MIPHHIKGSENLADYLSRCLETKEYVPSTDLKLNICQVAKQTEALINDYVAQSDISMEQLISETDKDPHLKQIKDFILSGKKSMPNKNTNKYASMIDELCLSEKGVLIKQHQIIIPNSMQLQLIERAHESHLGINQTRRLLKSRYFFTGMDKMILDRANKCLACQASRRCGVRKQPVKSSPLPPDKNHLWSIDFTSKLPSNEYILLAVDEFSRYPIIKMTKGLTSKQAITALKAVFKVYGIPKRIKSDNGPAFRSNEFANFAKDMNFEHQLITPEHPEANGMCEGFMKNINKTIRIAKLTGQNWKMNLERYLRDYKSTPHSTTLISPNVLHGIEENVWPSIKQNTSREQIKAIALSNDIQNKTTQRKYQNKNTNAKETNIKVGDVVLHALPKDKHQNKFNMPCDPNPYKVTHIKGSMVTALNHNRELTRDLGDLKLINKALMPDIQPKQIEIKQVNRCMYIVNVNDLPHNLIQQQNNEEAADQLAAQQLATEQAAARLLQQQQARTAAAQARAANARAIRAAQIQTARDTAIANARQIVTPRPRATSNRQHENTNESTSITTRLRARSNTNYKETRNYTAR